MLIFYTILLLTFSTLTAHEGVPVSLFKDASSRVFIQDEKGKDTAVRVVSGIEQFKEIVFDNNRPTVIKFFSSFYAPVANSSFGHVAGELRSSVDFATVDLATQQDIAESFKKMFIALSMQSKESGREDMHKLLMQLLLLTSMAQKKDGKFHNFVLFFKNGNLIVPGTIFFDSSDNLKSEISKKLLAAKVAENFYQVRDFLNKADAKNSEHKLLSGFEPDKLKLKLCKC